VSVPIGFEQARAAAARFLQEPVRLFEEATDLNDDGAGGQSSIYREVEFPRPLVGWIAAPSARRAAGGMADREPEEVAYQVENTKVVVCVLPQGTPCKEGDIIFAVEKWWLVNGELSLDSIRNVTKRVLMRETDEPVITV
jgi:hypothetical protein